MDYHNLIIAKMYKSGKSRKIYIRPLPYVAKYGPPIKGVHTWLKNIKDDNSRGNERVSLALHYYIVPAVHFKRPERFIRTFKRCLLVIMYDNVKNTLRAL